MRNAPFAVVAAASVFLVGCGGAPIAPAPHSGFIPDNRLAALQTNAATHKLYVADSTSNAITVYASAATGNSAPLRRIHGTATGLNQPSFLALDAAGDLFVANLAGNSITEYAPNASGNAVPIAVLSGGVTQLSSPSAIALDATGRVYVANFASSGSYITVYHANPNGGVAPSQTIFDSVGFYQIAGLAVHGTTIYASVIDLAFNTEINEYPTTSNGIVSPSAQISGVGNPNGIAVEPNGKIVVADGSTIKVYAANANGGSPPLQTIAGSATHLNGPIGVALGSGEIFIADQSTPAITAYKITWTGDKAPLTDLTGTLTKLAAPVGIAFRP
jgi:6-phosphogluconolactonase (cycloisomerase 2 family)